MKIRKLTVAGAIAASMGLVALGVLVKTALANGPLGDPPLIYSGTLTDQGGPANGTYQIAIKLRKTADTSSSTNELCSVAPGDIDVTAGQFQIALSDACKVALQNNRTAFYEIIVAGTSLGTTQVAAVPYSEFAVIASNVQRPASVRLGDGGVGTTFTSGPAYCGSTAATNGSFAATDLSGHALTGIAAAKELCRSACSGSQTAHLCSQAELKTFQDTVGFPMAVSVDGWILVEPYGWSSGGSAVAQAPCNFASWGGGCNAISSGAYTMSVPPSPASCTYNQAGAQYTLTGANWGVTYGPNGITTNLTCDQSFPIHCCQ